MQRHPSFRAGVSDRRDREFAAARTAQDVDALQAKWSREDTQMMREDEQQSTEVSELRRRLDRLGKDYYSGRVPEQVADVLADMIVRIDALERGQLRFMGTHEAGMTYSPNSLVVRKGGLWLSLTNTPAAPGTSGDWQLVTKSGSFDGGVA